MAGAYGLLMIDLDDRCLNRIMFRFFFHLLPIYIENLNIKTDINTFLFTGMADACGLMIIALKPFHQKLV